MPSSRSPILRFSLGPARDYLEDLTDSDSSPESVIAAVERYGNLRVRRAALASAIRDRQSRPRLRGYPPKVFIAYRWQGETQRQWVISLATYLRGLGYRVLLDLDHLEDLGPHAVKIGTYVSNLVDAAVVLRVITKEYVDGLLREWLLEEDQLAKRMMYTGLEVLHVVLPGGDEPSDWGRHAMVDLRDNPQAFDRIAERLPAHRGIVLDTDQEDALVDLLGDAAAALEAGRGERALSILYSHDQFADTFEYRQVLAHALYAIDDFSSALSVAESIDLLPGRPTVETDTDLALLFDELGMPGEALRRSVSLSRLPGPRRPSYLKMIGSLLDDLGCYQAAINFLGYAATLAEKEHELELLGDIRNTLGHVFLYRLHDAERARPHFEAALRCSDAPLIHTNLLRCLATLGHAVDFQIAVDAAWNVAGQSGDLTDLLVAVLAGEDIRVTGTTVALSTTHQCDGCGSGFAVRDQATLCGGCASSNDQPFSTTWVCHFCNEASLSPLGWLEDSAGCPVCREGVVSALDPR